MKRETNEKREEERERRERDIVRRDRELKNVSKPKNPPDELSHNDSEKIPVALIIRSKVQNLFRVF